MGLRGARMGAGTLMQKLSSVCKCGHRAISHTPAIGNGCDICSCKKFVAETDTEKLRALFYGDHNFSHDFEHDAKLYAAALEHKYAQAVAIAQINIEAGRECKKELEKAQGDMVKAQLLEGVALAKLKQAEQERDAAREEIARLQDEWQKGFDEGYRAGLAAEDHGAEEDDVD